MANLVAVQVYVPPGQGHKGYYKMVLKSPNDPAVQSKIQKKDPSVQRLTMQHLMDEIDQMRKRGMSPSEAHTELINQAKQLGITWNESPKEGVNWSRAVKAMIANTSSAPKADSKYNFNPTGGTKMTMLQAKFVNRSYTAHLSNDSDRQAFMSQLEANGITWTKHTKVGINWMRASMALTKFIQNGGSLTLSQAMMGNQNAKKNGTAAPATPAAPAAPAAPTVTAKSIAADIDSAIDVPESVLDEYIDSAYKDTGSPMHVADHLDGDAEVSKSVMDSASASQKAMFRQLGICADPNDDEALDYLENVLLPSIQSTTSLKDELNAAMAHNSISGGTGVIFKNNKDADMYSNFEKIISKELKIDKLSPEIGNTLETAANIVHNVLGRMPKASTYNYSTIFSRSGNANFINEFGTFGSSLDTMMNTPAFVGYPYDSPKKHLNPELDEYSTALMNAAGISVDDIANDNVAAGGDINQAKKYVKYEISSALESYDRNYFGRVKPIGEKLDSFMSDVQYIIDNSPEKGISDYGEKLKKSVDDLLDLMPGDNQADKALALNLLTDRLKYTQTGSFSPSRQELMAVIQKERDSYKDLMATYEKNKAAGKVKPKDVQIQEALEPLKSVLNDYPNLSKKTIAKILSGHINYDGNEAGATELYTAYKKVASSMGSIKSGEQLTAEYSSGLKAYDEFLKMDDNAYNNLLGALKKYGSIIGSSNSADEDSLRVAFMANLSYIRSTRSAMTNDSRPNTYSDMSGKSTPKFDVSSLDKVPVMSRSELRSLMKPSGQCRWALKIAATSPHISAKQMLDEVSKQRKGKPIDDSKVASGKFNYSYDPKSFSLYSDSKVVDEIKSSVKRKQDNMKADKPILTKLSTVSGSEFDRIVGVCQSTHDMTNHGHIHIQYHRMFKVEGMEKNNESYKNHLAQTKAAGASYYDADRFAEDTAKHDGDWFFHGTGFDATAGILGKTGGFLQGGGLMGAGHYLAKNVSKSAQYLRGGANNFSRHGVRGSMFLCDAVLGHTTEYSDTDLSGYDSRAKYSHDSYDSVVGGTTSAYSLKNLEWAVKDPSRVVPRYLIDVEV